MRVIVAGASGAVGKVLVPELVRRGHEVAGLVRSATGDSLVRKLGAEPLVTDALDRQALLERLARVRPNAVIHQLTALPLHFDLRDFDAVFAQTTGCGPRVQPT